VNVLAFLSPDLVAAEASLVSPLARALSGAGPVRDVSELGKLELRGDLTAVAVEPGEELIRIAPGRALLVTEGSPAAARTRLRAAGLRVYDLSAGLAALEIDGAQLLRRLTDLDLDSLPAAGAVARGVAALVQRTGDDTFRIFVQQELGHFETREGDLGLMADFYRPVQPALVVGVRQRSIAPKRGGRAEATSRIGERPPVVADGRDPGEPVR